MRRGAVAVLVSIVAVAFLGVGAADAQMQGWAQQHGIDLPRPWGFGLTLYDQTQGYNIVSLEASIAGFDLGQIPDLKVDNVTTTYQLQLDYWVLPFLNVFALVGDVSGTTTVDLRHVDLGVPLPLTSLAVEYDGTVYGGGATLAGGTKRYFATLTYDYTNTELDVSTSSVKAWVLTPKVGMHWNGTAIWVGAMYQNVEEKHAGVFDVPYLGQVPFSVELEAKDAWNNLIGMNGEIGKHWVLVLEGGFGNRDYALGSLTYRF